MTSICFSGSENETPNKFGTHGELLVSNEGESSLTDYIYYNKSNKDNESQAQNCVIGKSTGSSRT